MYFFFSFVFFETFIDPSWSTQNVTRYQTESINIDFILQCVQFSAFSYYIVFLILIHIDDLNFDSSYYINTKFAQKQIQIRLNERKTSRRNDKRAEDDSVRFFPKCVEMWNLIYSVILRLV